MLTNNIIFYSDEISIKISVNKDLFKKMYQYCDKSYPNETGGILIGTYLDKQTAEIVEVIGPSEDSKTWKTRFNRGAKGINKLLKEYWEQEIYYLGEWHFHPNGSPYPSNIDTDTLTSISNNSKYSCPEPILIIISGSHNCYNQKSYLYSSTGQKFEMNC